MTTVNQDKCVGCGLCAGLAPDNFEMNLAGKAEPTGRTITEAARQAAALCPRAAIQL